MIELGAAARPSCVIGASVWASTLDKSACPNWVVPIDATIDFEKKNEHHTNMQPGTTGCLERKNAFKPTFSSL